MAIRQSITAEGFSHGALPIPAASRIGPFVATGNVFGFDFDSAAHPESAGAQAELMFAHLRRILAAAGCGFADVLKLTVYVRDDGVRGAINTPWLAAFPDEASRPARQTILMPTLPEGRLVACDALAIAPD